MNTLTGIFYKNLLNDETVLNLIIGTRNTLFLNFKIRNKRILIIHFFESYFFSSHVFIKTNLSISF